MIKRILVVLALTLAVAPSRAASLDEASEEAKGWTKQLKTNPCYQNIELSVRGLKLTLRASPQQAHLLDFTRECRVEGAPEAPRAVRFYSAAEDLTGVRLITALGSDETTVVLLARTDAARPEAGWTVLGELGRVKTAALLSSAGVSFASGLDLVTVPPEHRD